MRIFIISLAIGLLLTSCGNNKEDCKNPSILKNVTYFNVDDGLVGKDKIHARLEYNNGFIRTERVGQVDYIIGRTYCDNTSWDGTYKLN